MQIQVLITQDVVVYNKDWLEPLSIFLRNTAGYKGATQCHTARYKIDALQPAALE